MIIKKLTKEVNGNEIRHAVAVFGDFKIEFTKHVINGHVYYYAVQEVGGPFVAPTPLTFNHETVLDCVSAIVMPELLNQLPFNDFVAIEKFLEDREDGTEEALIIDRVPLDSQVKRARAALMTHGLNDTQRDNMKFIIQMYACDNVVSKSAVARWLSDVETEKG